MKYEAAFTEIRAPCDCHPHRHHLCSHSIIWCCWTPRARPDEQLRNSEERALSGRSRSPSPPPPPTPLTNVTAPPTFPPPSQRSRNNKPPFCLCGESEGGRSDRKKPLGRRSLRLWAPPAAQRLRPLAFTRDKTQPGDYRKTTEGDYRFSRVKIKRTDRVFLSFSFLFSKRNGEAEEGSAFKRREAHRRKRKITAFKNIYRPRRHEVVKSDKIASPAAGGRHQKWEK